MATHRSTAPRRRTKTEVQRDLTTIAEQVSEEKESISAKTLEAAKMREEEIRSNVKNISVDSVTSHIAELGAEVSKTLSGLSEKLLQETQSLADLKEAVALEAKELERLHKIDVLATALDQLLSDYELKKTALEEEIAEQREVWQKEEAEHGLEAKEFEDGLKKARTREKEEYEYQKSLERKKEEDAYEEQRRVLERKNKERQEMLEKSWQEREIKLKERETELESLRAQAVQFPDKLKVETAKAVEENAKLAAQRYEQQILILKKDAEAEKRLTDQQIQSLKEKVGQQFESVQNLQAELALAKKQVQDIAEKAIDGASGAKTLAHINQIAMEQAKRRDTQA